MIKWMVVTQSEILLGIFPNPSGLNAPIERSEMKSWIYVDSQRLFVGDDEKEDMYGNES